MTLILQPTLDTEIATLKQAIKAEEVHTTRAEYIATVQPMKDELINLKAQNEIIKAENKAAQDAYIPIPTAEELESKRNADIATEIALTYSLADEIAILRQLAQGTLELTDVKCTEWIGVVSDAKSKYPEE